MSAKGGECVMNIVEMTKRSEDTIMELCQIWKRAVEKTHHFLSVKEIDELAQTLPEALRRIPHLLVVKDESHTIVAFVGIRERDIDLLFVDPIYHKRGIGRACIEYAIEQYQVDSLCVNEQNPQAKAFYEHLGFQVIRRSNQDEQGRPYPLLYMKLKK